MRVFVIHYRPLNIRKTCNNTDAARKPKDTTQRSRAAAIYFPNFSGTMPTTWGSNFPNREMSSVCTSATNGQGRCATVLMMAKAHR
jgi:hypothetical protein